MLVMESYKWLKCLGISSSRSCQMLEFWKEKKKFVLSHIQETAQYVVAHALAMRVISSPHFMIWMESVPPDIKDLISTNLAQV